MYSTLYGPSRLLVSESSCIYEAISFIIGSSMVNSNAAYHLRLSLPILQQSGVGTLKLELQAAA